jgi:hypothetical protein
MTPVLAVQKTASLSTTNHFSREAKLMVFVVLLPIVLGLIAAVLVPLFLRH